MSTISTVTSNLATATATATNLFTPTQTQNVAFTTPFVHPSGCQEIWQSTTTLSSHVNHGVTTTYALPIVYSDPARPEYSSCQPSGYSDRVASRRHDYEPAVCPSGWWALHVSQVGFRTSIEGPMSMSRIPPYHTAYCCKSGWGINTSMTMGDIVGVCTIDYNSFASSSAVIASATAAPTPAPGVLYRDATRVAAHPPWRITWEYENGLTMTPQFPSLAYKQHIPTWTPGMNVAAYAVPNNRQSDEISLTFTYIFAYYLPLLLVIGSMLACCTCCWKRSRRRSADTWKEREAWREAENLGRFSDVEEPRPRWAVNAGRDRRRGERGVDVPPPYSRHDEGGPVDYVQALDLGAGRALR